MVVVVVLLPVLLELLMLSVVFTIVFFWVFFSPTRNAQPPKRSTPPLPLHLPHFIPPAPFLITRRPAAAAAVTPLRRFIPPPTLVLFSH